MTEVLRPSLYGAQHPQVVVPRKPTTETASYVVTGHCCESGDLMTPAPGEPETILERVLTKATPDDCYVIEACGAYCSSMSTKHYNSFPEAPEVMIVGGKVHLIRKPQAITEIWKNECDLPAGSF
jgi:diaminopimelate decarboxylase